MSAIVGDLSERQGVSTRGWKALADTSRSRSIAGLCLFVVTYCIAYKFGMSFSQATASPFWFPDSVLLCALLLTSPRRWWIFILTALPIRLLMPVATGVPPWFLLTTFAIDSAKGMLAATALRLALRNPRLLETLRD